MYMSLRYLWCLVGYDVRLYAVVVSQVEYRVREKIKGAPVLLEE